MANKTKHFNEPGPLHRDPIRPLFNPRVYKVGQAASDARFIADGYTANADNPENDYNIIEHAGRFAAFDKRGDLIGLGDDATSHGYLLAHNNPTAETASSDRNNNGTTYLVAFTAPQLAEFLERFDGEPRPLMRGEFGIRFKFDRKPPIRVIEMRNPHTEETEPVLILDSVPEFATIDKVIGKLININQVFRTESQLKLAVCQDEINGLDSAYHHETDIEQKGLKLAAVDKAKADYAALIPEEARVFHNLTTDPDIAASSRTQLHTHYYESRPAHQSALKLIKERAAASDTTTPL